MYNCTTHVAHLHLNLTWKTVQNTQLINICTTHVQLYNTNSKFTFVQHSHVQLYKISNTSTLVWHMYICTTLNIMSRFFFTMNLQLYESIITATVLEHNYVHMYNNHSTSFYHQNIFWKQHVYFKLCASWLSHVLCICTAIQKTRGPKCFFQLSSSVLFELILNNKNNNNNHLETNCW